MEVTRERLMEVLDELQKNMLLRIAGIYSCDFRIESVSIDTRAPFVKQFDNYYGRA